MSWEWAFFASTALIATATAWMAVKAYMAASSWEESE